MMARISALVFDRPVAVSDDFFLICIATVV